MSPKLSHALLRWPVSVLLPATLIAVHLDGRRALSISLPTPQPASGVVAQAPNNWALVEQEIIAEHNRVRQNPQSYIPLLQAYLARMDAQGNIPNGCGQNCTLRTQEGKAAVEEAIRFLQQQAALNAISLSSGVASAAKDHAQDQQGGAIGHTGSDGSTPAQRVARYGVNYRSLGENIDYGSTTAQGVLMSLIIDDGVPGRGHRTNIFAPDWTHAGAGCGSHAVYGSVCVVGYIKAPQGAGQGTGSTGNTPTPSTTSPAAANNQLTVINNGTVNLESIQISGVELLGTSLAPGESRRLSLNADQCQVDLTLQLGGGYRPLVWENLEPCGATLTVDSDNGFRLAY